MTFILAFAHETLPPALVTTLIVVGIVIIGGALTGTGFELAGAKIGDVFGWKRQLAVGLFGVAVLGFGLWSSSAEDWLRTYNELVKEADDHAISPGLRDRLGLLVDRAGNNYFRNCRIADFIFDHSIPSPPPSLVRKLDTAQHNNSPGLNCYREKVAQAQQIATQAALATPSPEPTSGTAIVTLKTPMNASTAQLAIQMAKSLLKAATGPGQVGWLYLGRIAGGKLADATIFERFPNEHQLITLTTDVSLHDPHTSSGFSKSAIIGVVPAWSQVLVEQFHRSADYLWAKVQVVRNDSTSAVQGPHGLRLAGRGCPVRQDRDTVRSNATQWIILGSKAGGSDRLLSPNVDAFCIPRNNEVVTITKDVPLFVGWDPQTQTNPSRVNLHLTGKVLPAGTKVRIVTGLGALRSARGLYTVYAPVEVTSPANLSGK